MKTADFIEEEDYGIEFECEDCDRTGDYTEFLDTECCPDCESNSILISTSHEGVDCSECGGALDMWETGYRNAKEGILICEDCYEELED